LALACLLCFIAERVRKKKKDASLLGWMVDDIMHGMVNEETFIALFGGCTLHLAGNDRDSYMIGLTE
jgi:hypothetical protein